MKNYFKVVITILLIISITSTFSACGTSSDGAAGGGDAKSDSKGPFTIGYSQLGIDWILMEYQDNSEKVIEVDNPENTFKAVDCSYNTDKMQTDIQNLISSGVDGLIYLPTFTTLTPIMMEMCESAGTPFVGHCHTPTDEQLTAFAENPQSAGYIGSDPFKMGAQLGEEAIKNGGKIALVNTGSEGLIDMDGRKDGFIDAFEKGGGKVVAVAHCANPQEVTAKVSDMLAAHPEADTIYGVTGVAGIGAIPAIANYKRTDSIKLYCTDIDGDLLNNIRNDELVAGDGGSGIEAVLATCLLMNKLAGHPILDENGKAPVSIEVPQLIITKDNADLFQKIFLDDTPFTDEMISKLLYSSNPDVTWSDYQEWIDNYSWEWLVEKRKG